MMLKHYDNINDFLSAMGLPLIKNKNFYIAKFEDHNYNINNPECATSHEYFDISFTIGYDADVYIGERKANALEYNLSFVSPGQITKWQLNEIQNKPLSYIILFKPEFLPFANDVFSIYETFPYFNNNTLSSFKLTAAQKKMFITYLGDIYREYQLNSESSFEIIKSYLNILLFNAKRELEYSDGVSYLKSRSQEITYNFENLIKKTKHKHQPIKYYAEKLNISPIYLAECVKKVTSKTAKQIINEYLVLEAKSLLKQSNESIAEIAYALGFEDNSNFVKYFKKQTGVTPKQYKK
ncbi:helix-turn-helix domain-containing protein [Aquimarina rhabdastrellae]